MESPDAKELTSRIVFGVDSVLKLPHEIARLDAKRVLLISTPQQKDHLEMLQALLGESAAAVFSGAAMHTPARK